MVQASKSLILVSWSLIGTILAHLHPPGYFQYRLRNPPKEGNFYGTEIGYPEYILKRLYDPKIIDKFYHGTHCKTDKGDEENNTDGKPIHRAGVISTLNRQFKWLVWEIKCLGGECISYEDKNGYNQIYCTKAPKRYVDDYGHDEFARGQGTELLLKDVWQK